MGDPMTAAWLLERLQSYGQAPALVYPLRAGQEATASYEQVLVASERFFEQFTERGIRAGHVVALEGRLSLGPAAALLALIRLGAIVVPLVREMRPHRETFLTLAEATLLVEFDDNDAASFALLGAEPAWPQAPLLTKLKERGHPGLIIFSSGSTGAPKAIVHDFVALLAKFEKPRQQKTTLCFLLFDHIGGVDTLLNTFSSGGTLVTVARREPLLVVEAIQKHRVHTLPTSPTFLGMLLMAGVIEGRDLSSLRVIAYGTEPMPPSTLARLHEAFPDVALVQTYGMSELGVLRSRSKDSGSLWLKFSDEGFETKVVDGVLWVKADAAMLGYLNAPDLFDEEGWLNTQDAVEVDGEYLRILGRVTELINVGGQKVYPSEVEAHLLQMDNVADVAVFGRPHPMMGQMVAARFSLKQPEALSELKVRLHAFCRGRLAAYQIPRLVEITEADQFGVRFKKVRHV
jgi:long-chain acyl-CoA synthetase